MNSTLSNTLMFIAGAAAGSAVAWKILKTKYERIAQEEIDSVKATFSKRYGKPEDETDVEEVEVVKEEPHVPDAATVRDYAAVLAKNGYTDYANTVVVEKKEITAVAEEDGPYVISPEEFGSRDDYETVSLTYYSDGVVADDMDYRVDDLDSIVGIESLTRFGEYEDDSVFVRNDELKTDYEILLDTRRYADVTRNPRPDVTEE